ncbi:histone-lysine N-methyltransferase SETMAR [Elysia marginata]|nr:histone-lysine N-methyltransferase SETMAR [Elysia marginata]
MKRLRFYETLPHPSYSPDLAPSDFYLFPKLKEHIKGKHFEDDDAVQEDVRRWFRGKPHEFFADGMRKLIWRWRACVD